MNFSGDKREASDRDFLVRKKTTEAKRKRSDGNEILLEKKNKMYSVLF